MNTHARVLPSSSRRINLTLALVVITSLIAVTALWLTRADANATESSSAGFPSAPPAAPGSVVTTAGDVSDLDKTFLVKVRQADLWEGPAGRLAQTHASSEAVKRAGLHLLEGHSKLDQMDREAAKALNVTIPNRASTEQRRLLKQLEDAQGTEFDKLFANILRGTHGKIFVTIGIVRATTKNTMIRNLATQANITVMDHQAMMEETGLVTEATLNDVTAEVAPQ